MNASEAEKKCPCGQPHDNWPGDGEEMLCQMCWEAYCSRIWWEYNQRLAEIMRMEAEHGA